MASTDTELKPPAKPLTLNAVDDLADYVQKIAIQTEDDDSESSESPDAAPRPFFSYSRPQILNLYKSPLVQVPEGMPELKEWFGCGSHCHKQSQLCLSANAVIGMSSSQPKRIQMLRLPPPVVGTSVKMSDEMQCSSQFYQVQA
jgi:hypothetical protein